MKEYLKKIRDLKLPTPEEEKALWFRYKRENEQEARQELISYYQPLVFKLVQQFKADRGVFMDLIQEGNLGLIDAVDSYRPGLNTRFSTFAVYHIKGRIIDYLNKGSRARKFPVRGDILSEKLEETVERSMLVDRVKELVKGLPPRERQVINKRFLDSKKAELAAAEMGISLSYLYRLQKKAVRRLRGKLATFIHQWNK